MAARLYRRILCVGRSWAGLPEEKEYILTEARTRFRADANISDPQTIAMRLKEAEERLQLAVHYGIAYPRLHHKQQIVDHLYAPDVAHVGAMPHSRNESVNSKLAAAAKRLQQKKGAPG